MTTRTQETVLAIGNTLQRIEPELDSLKGLISLEIKVSYDDDGSPGKVQISLHTTRLTPTRLSG